MRQVWKTGQRCGTQVSAMQTVSSLPSGQDIQASLSRFASRN